MGVSMDRCSYTNAHSHSWSQMSESFWNPNTLHIDKDRRVSLRFMYSYGALEQRQRSATRRTHTHSDGGVLHKLHTSRIERHKEGGHKAIRFSVKNL